MMERLRRLQFQEHSTTKLTGTTLIDCGQHRTSSRSVSWNVTGNLLAMASSDRMARVWTVESASSTSREILAVSGHTAPVLRTRFHPVDASLLCTSAADASVRFWDVRAASQRAVGRIDLQAGSSAFSVEWFGGRPNGINSSLHTHALVIAERDGTVCVYDTRKLSSTTSGGSGASNPSRHAGAVAVFPMRPQVVETCIFSPDGSYLIGGSTVRGEGVGEIQIWRWFDDNKGEIVLSEKGPNPLTYPAHAGPIYAMALSHQGKRLATGGCDATVGLWDTDAMICTHAISRRTKFIRGVAFSPDDLLLATCSEDDGIDIADAATGVQIGLVQFQSGARGAASSGSTRASGGGAEDISWHPKETYLLACARTEPMGGGLLPSPVTVAKITCNTLASQ